MSIQFDCENCQKKLKVPQSAAGKRGRCNQCGHLNTIPAVASAETIIDTAAANDGGAPVATPIGSGSGDETYNVKSAVNGAVFGPADSATLQKWLDEGRITPNCQLQETGTTGWTMASAMFPALGSTAGSADAFSQFQQTSQTHTQTNPGELNPYAPAPKLDNSARVARGIVPTSGDISFCISHGWKVWTGNFGLLLAAFVTLGVIGLVLGLAKEGVVAAAAANGNFTWIALIGTYIVTNLVSMWLTLGFIKMICQLARGERAEYAQLFSRGGRMPLTILILLPFFVIGGGFEIYTHSMKANPNELLPVAFGFAGVMMLVSLFIWPVYFLLADTELGFECVKKGLSIGARNCLISIPIFFVAFLIGASGVIACGIGIIATMPAMYAIAATAYLNMSSQLMPR